MVFRIKRAKIADASVVLDNVLCFMIARYGKTANKPLKDAVLDF